MDVVVVPFGGGGLAAGIALALRAAGSRARVVACEVSTAAPFAAALAAARPVPVSRQPSFVDGIGSLRVLDAMWPLARTLIAGVEVVTPGEAAEGLRALARDAGLVAEGAAAVAYVAGRRLRDAEPSAEVAVVLSGRNIDPDLAATIIAGGDAP